MKAARRVLALAGALAWSCMSVVAGPAMAGDAAAWQRGEEIYARCAACHAIESNRTGPQHCGLFGRRAGTAPGYDNYSKAMRASGIVWNADTLDRFLLAPLQAVPGTTMGYAGIKDKQERAELIAWLRHATRPGTACKPNH